VALVLVAGATIVVTRQVAQDVALRHAKMRGVSFARVVGGPAVTPGVTAGHPKDLEAFTTLMRNRLRDKSMVHIKVWSPDGRVIWADEHGLRGRVFPLEPGVRRLFRTGGAVADMSSLDKAENVDERGESSLLEVYAAARDSRGRRIIVESYWSAAHLNEDAAAVMRRVAPLALGALLLFAMLIFPLAWSLARWADRAQQESQRMLRHALSASDLERRRIARDLHDGVMQDLSGAGYALTAAAAGIPTEARVSRRIIDELTVIVKHASASMRSMLADIYPADLTHGGLVSGVEELARRAEDAGVRVHVDVADLACASTDVAQLSYRVIREGLRNVVRHAHASQAEVRGTISGADVVISVADDGRGLAPPAAGNGHVGLRLLEDTVRDLGGALVLAPGPEHGTVLSATFPANISGR
jgi:signal transduction histidine kinase